MTTPNGSPAWLRTSDFATYGGHTEKVNYQSQGVVNPRTDVGAEAVMRFTEDLAAAVRTAEFSRVLYTNNDSTPAVPTINTVFQMNGDSTSDYAGDSAPAGMPSAARNGDGDVTFTWATSYTDAYGVSGTVNITDAKARVIASSGVYSVPCEILSANSVRVRAFDATSGSAVQDAQVLLNVGTGPS